MFTAENQLVTTDLAPQDTVFQMMGIVKRMQKLATRTILFGEVRGDLVVANPNVASTDVQQLYNNNVTVDNAYNKPRDYYDVINNCNVYLAHVDSVLKTHGRYMYEKEVCAAKTFRAWCYLELVKIYGAVPFVTEPILTADAAEKVIASGEKVNIEKILDFFIADLEGFADRNYNNGLRPKYGNVDYENIGFDNFFIPVRVLLGELYLWRGSLNKNVNDYYKAIGMYHDYLCFTGEERAVRNYTIEWYDRFAEGLSSSYTSLFSGNMTDRTFTEFAAIIPNDTVQYYGTTNNLIEIFCSQYSNKYYPWVTMSQRMKDISAGQDYCYYDYQSSILRDTIYMSKDMNKYTSLWERYATYLVGDMRLYADYTTGSNAAERRYHSDVNEIREFISKWLLGSSSTSTDVKLPCVPIYRNSIIYLHLAEALNRAGLPETAYAILSHGLTYEVMNNRNIISQREFDILCSIKSRGLTLQENRYDEDSEEFEKTRNSAAIWPSIFRNLDKTVPRVNGDFLPTSTSGDYIVQIGIHSRGCGDTEVNAKYYLDDEVIKAGLVPVPTKPRVVPEAPKPNDVIAYEAWLDANGLTGKNESQVVKNQYSNYVKLNADSLAAYVAYPDLYYQYQTDSIAYQKAVNKNIEYLASASVTARRQARVAKLILDEEALEGCFEGYRFYDIMRYQIQEGVLDPRVVSSTITLPSYISETYHTFNGATPWKDNMTGKPWFIPLPKR